MAQDTGIKIEILAKRAKRRADCPNLHNRQWLIEQRRTKSYAKIADELSTTSAIVMRQCKLLNVAEEQSVDDVKTTARQRLRERQQHDRV